MKTVLLACIALLWAVCMVYGTLDVWSQGVGEVAMLWALLTVLCLFMAGLVLTVVDFLTGLRRHFGL